MRAGIGIASDGRIDPLREAVQIDWVEPYEGSLDFREVPERLKIAIALAEAHTARRRSPPR